VTNSLHRQQTPRAETPQDNPVPLTTFQSGFNGGLNMQMHSLSLSARKLSTAAVAGTTPELLTSKTSQSHRPT